VKRYLKSQLFTLLIVITGASLTASISNAQEDSACFMTDANGRTINLGNLCSGATSNSPRKLQALIKRREGGTPVIEVTFNGRQTFEMLFDTGASDTVITPQMAQALRVVPQGSAIFETAGGIIRVPLGRVTSVAAGGIVINNLVVGINPSLSLGLLGQDFFGNYDVTIKQNVVEFRPR
jgi:aspartyl protease family protein